MLLLSQGGYSHRNLNPLISVMSDTHGYGHIALVDDGLQQLPLTSNMLIVHLVCICLGIPLNVFVGLVIIRNRRLHNPRNTFWLGSILCHLTALLFALLECLVSRSPSSVPCFMYSTMIGTSYTVLLINSLLATLDRWAAISHPLWHRKHVTVIGVILVQLASAITVTFLLTLPFWSRLLPLRCGVHQTVITWITSCYLLLAVLGLIAQTIVYLKARKYLVHYNVARCIVVYSKTAASEDELDAKAASLVIAHPRRSHFFVHGRDKTISKLELEATITLVVGVMSLCLFTIPFALVFITARIRPSPSIMSIIPYARQLALVHVLYNPLMYVIRSREFKWVLNQMLPFQSTSNCFLKCTNPQSTAASTSFEHLRAALRCCSPIQLIIGAKIQSSTDKTCRQQYAGQQ